MSIIILIGWVIVIGCICGMICTFLWCLYVYTIRDRKRRKPKDAPTELLTTWHREGAEN